MTRRWPNTKHWQRVVEIFRETHESRWRTAAARRLGCEKRSLRARIDREDLDPVIIKRIDDLLIEHLQRYADHLRSRAGDAWELAKSVMRASAEVSTVTLAEYDLVDTDTDTEFIGPRKISAFSAAVLKFLEDA